MRGKEATHGPECDGDTSKPASQQASKPHTPRTPCFGRGMRGKRLRGLDTVAGGGPCPSCGDPPGAFQFEPSDRSKALPLRVPGVRTSSPCPESTCPLVAHLSVAPCPAAPTRSPEVSRCQVPGTPALPGPVHAPSQPDSEQNPQSPPPTNPGLARRSHQLLSARFIHSPTAPSHNNPSAIHRQSFVYTQQPPTHATTVSTWGLSFLRQSHSPTSQQASLSDLDSIRSTRTQHTGIGKKGRTLQYDCCV